MRSNINAGEVTEMRAVLRVLAVPRSGSASPRPGLDHSMHHFLAHTGGEHSFNQQMHNVLYLYFNPITYLKAFPMILVQLNMYEPIYWCH